jgi:hypothetical protein
MNKWKIAFWICLTLLIGGTLFGLFSIVDQGVTLTYLRESCDDTEKDLNTLVELINETNLSKGQIEEKLKTHYLFEFMDFRQDKIQIHRLTLIFKNDKLVRLEKQ